MTGKLSIFLRPDERLSGLSHFNALVGRNGSGKSTFIRHCVNALRTERAVNVAIVTPERGGILQLDAGIEQNIRSNINWVLSQRTKNRSENFRQTSISRLREVYLGFLHDVMSIHEIRYSDKTFETEYIEDLNSLLPNVLLRVERNDIEFTDVEGAKIPSEGLSSGESEALSLSIEVLHFFQSASSEKLNLLFLDEPDVHLHPDLQARFVRFVVSRFSKLQKEIADRTFIVFATHSTPFVAALLAEENSTVGVKRFGSSKIEFIEASEVSTRVAPFIAHPLSSVFNLEIPIIVEGEDDERVWQQASRSSTRKLSVFPCVSGSVSRHIELENFFQTFLPAFYDAPVAFSVRDGDGRSEALVDAGCVRRFRLQCYAIENLILTDESLEVLGANWADVSAGLNEWMVANPSRPEIAILREVLGSGNRGRHLKIKTLVAIILGVTGSKKPWQTVVGQAIASSDISTESEDSIVDYVGKELLLAIGL